MQQPERVLIRQISAYTSQTLTVVKHDDHVVEQRTNRRLFEHYTLGLPEEIEPFLLRR